MEPCEKRFCSSCLPAVVIHRPSGRKYCQRCAAFEEGTRPGSMEVVDTLERLIDERVSEERGGYRPEEVQQLMRLAWMAAKEDSKIQERIQWDMTQN